MGEVYRLFGGLRDDEPSLVPSGEYRLSFAGSKLVTRFDRGVLELWFKIGDMASPYYGKQLARYYNVQRSRGQKGFSARPGSAFVREYAAVFGVRPDFRRATLERFQGVRVLGRVETVKRDHRQELLLDVLRYSTVRELLRLAD